MYTIQGLEVVDYTNKNNARITGTKLHLSYETDKVQGTAVELIYVGSAIDCSHLHIGDNVDVMYNRYGKVCEIKLA